MKYLSAVLILFLVSQVNAATLKEHPVWRSEKLPDLYYEVLAASVPTARKAQAPDGRFRSRIPRDQQADVRSFSMYDMQYIYVPALLYAVEHPSNNLHGEPYLLDMALAAGDYMAGIVTADGSFEPKVGGTAVSNLDSHRALYCWTETYGLLKNRLDAEREKKWRGSILAAGGRLAEDINARINRPRYTAPYLGTSPNHFGLWSATVFRIGMLMGKPEWVELARLAMHRFVREIAPGGYWAEHDGPTMTYDYLNSSVAGLYWHFSRDEAALEAIRRNNDFHMHWCTPDGVDIHTVDERNRSSFRVNASWGLFSFSNFPEGRRFARFKLLAALGDGEDPVLSLGLANLGRVAQSAHYHVEGEEAPIPHEKDSWRHVLDRPAVAARQGPWTWSYSALVSVRSPFNQFFLDRTCPVSLWHERCKHIIDGGNSKGQPELATFSVKRRNGEWDYLPLDAMMAGGAGSDTMCLALEGFSLRLTMNPSGGSTMVISAQAERTYNTPDTVFLNLPLILQPGKPINAGNGAEYTLGENEVNLSGEFLGGGLAYGAWRMSLPDNSRFIWPYYTYTPYGPTRVPKNLRSAVGVLTIPLDSGGGWIKVSVNVPG